jgi:glycosyltransferase involved in cell wall biosynthesis
MTLDLTVLTYSNSPAQPTGYGQQIEILIDNLVGEGAKVGHASNYGLEGINSTFETKHGPIPHYGKGYDPMSQDSAIIAFKQLESKYPENKSIMLTLIDAWVLNPKAFPKEDVETIISWVPLDHISMPPAVKRWLVMDHVQPIAMSPWGQEQMSEVGIESIYIPHSIDTVNQFKPTFKLAGKDTREFLGVKDDDFLIVVNSANKANGSVHRKSFGELFLAFATFRQKVPNAYLYVHTEPRGVYSGFQLARLAQACGLDMDSVIFPDPIDYRLGIDQADLAAIYTAADVSLQLAYGGGFEIPVIEAQACGTRAITIDWTGPKDLVAADGWTVSGQMFWDEAQAAWWKVPSVASVVRALEEAYDLSKAEGSNSKIARDFAKKFDNRKVWHHYWMPFLENLAK